MANHDHWHPSWHKPEHAMQWDRVKEAVRRDWQQTKHDLHAGGHELNQRVGDTMKQATGAVDIPSINAANPPKIIGEWDAAAVPVEYGYSARQQFGSTHAQWDDALDVSLRTEWESSPSTPKTSGKWDDVKPHVRHGYDYKS
jgi:hypothetical protein